MDDDGRVAVLHLQVLQQLPQRPWGGLDAALHVSISVSVKKSVTKWCATSAGNFLYTDSLACTTSVMVWSGSASGEHKMVRFGYAVQQLSIRQTKNQQGLLLR